MVGGPAPALKPQLFLPLFLRMLPMKSAPAAPASGYTAVFVILVVVALTALLASLALWRDLPGYSTETDFLGGMIGEASKLLAGEPMRSEFHPPAFPMVVAVAQSLIGDWFVTGKVIAIVSAAVTLLCTFWLFHGLAGRWAAWGAIGGLVCSATFLKFSIQATSDVFFLAIFTVSGLAVLLAADRRSLPLWFLAGLLVGIGFMTRTNGLTQFLLLAVPLLVPAPAFYRLKAVAAAAAGLLLLLGLSLVFAAVTGSNLIPAGTYHNLAMTYFSHERISWEGMIEARSRFNSLKEVLLYDPSTIIKTYARDLFVLLTSKAVGLSGPLLALLFLPGLIFMVADRFRGLVLPFLLVAIAQILLVNFKAFEPRYYMFMAPWLGASAGYLAWRFWQEDWSRFVKGAAVGLVLASFAFSTALAVTHTARFASEANPELADALGPLRELVTADDVVMSRKPHVGFVTGAANAWLPMLSTETELRAALAEADNGNEGRVFLFYGHIELRSRPDIEPLLGQNQRPDWLVEVATGTVKGTRWSLYEYRPLPSGTEPRTRLKTAPARGAP
jgi:4-amino-4-deoxy-L-arabinose transferase-like glycosyltransferase